MSPNTKSQLYMANGEREESGNQQRGESRGELRENEKESRTVRRRGRGEKERKREKIALNEGKRNLLFRLRLEAEARLHAVTHRSSSEPFRLLLRLHPSDSRFSLFFSLTHSLSCAGVLEHRLRGRRGAHETRTASQNPTSYSRDYHRSSICVSWPPDHDLLAT